MRYFQPPADTRFYAGVDLHARSLFLSILDRDGQERFARNLSAAPGPFRKAVQPFRDGLVVGCACLHCWYSLAYAYPKERRGLRDLLRARLRLVPRPFVTAPPACPLRDLLRARLRLVRQ